MTTRLNIILSFDGYVEEHRTEFNCTHR